MTVKLDISGQKFGRLIALTATEKRQHSRVVWLCQCDCGEEIEVGAGHLKSGNTKSCGCLRVESPNALKHGYAKHRPGPSSIYIVWVNMKARCLNKNRPHYQDWGGRGVTVCDRWLHSFENFLEDMGERPEGTSIDRIDNDGNYEPGNCRWATRKQQANNRRRVVSV